MTIKLETINRWLNRVGLVLRFEIDTARFSQPASYEPSPTKFHLVRNNLPEDGDPRYGTAFYQETKK